MIKNQKFHLTYFYILLIPVTILFTVLYSYTYTSQKNDFNSENLKTSSLITNALDDILSVSNTSSVQISSLASMKYVLAKKRGASMVDYKNIFDKIQENMSRYKIFDSIYIFFVDAGKVLTNFSFYDINTFYEKELLKKISKSDTSIMWFDYRRIAPNEYSYISPTNVVSLISQFPLTADYPSAYIIININQKKLLDSISNFKYADQVSIACNGKLIASMDEINIGKKLADVCENVSFSGDNGYCKINGEYVYYKKSAISDFLYINVVNEGKLNEMFSRYKYVMILMYIISVLALFIFSYLFSKLSKNHFGYLIHKLNVQLQKPSTKKLPDQGFTTLDKAIDDIMIRNKFVEDKIQSYNNIVKDTLIRDIISGNTCSQEELNKHLSYLNISFDCKYFTTFISVIVDFDIDKEAKNESFSYNVKLYLKDIIDNKLSAEFKVYSALVDNEKMGFIVNHDLKHDEIIKTLSNLLQEINSFIQNELGVYMLFSIGTSVENIYEITNSYYTAKKNLNYKSMCGSNLIIIDKSNEIDIPVFPVSIQHKIISGFKNNSRETIMQSLDCFFDEYLNNERYSLENTNNIAIILFCSTINALWENDFDLRIEDSFEIINSISKKNSSKALNQYLKELFISILEKQHSYTILDKSNNTHYITKVVNFINENCSKDLSISDIAMCVSLNPRYLGVLFKEATGKTLVEHLNIIRINKAKLLLVDTKKSIKEISFDVGYNDTHSFIRHFKKITSITPSEYRKKLDNNLDSKIPGGSMLL